MFRIDVDGLKNAADAAKTTKGDFENEFDGARKANFDVLDGQSGVWAQGAEKSYNLVDVSMTAFKSAFDSFSSSLAEASSDASDSLKPKYKELFAEVGSSPSNDQRISCNPDSNFGSGISDAAQKAQDMAKEASDLISHASDLDNECGERDAIISSLNEVKSYTNDEAEKFNNVKTKWDTLSQAVKAFDNTYSSKFSGDFVTADMERQAKTASAQAIVQHFLLSGDSAQSSDVNTNYADGSSGVTFEIGDDGEMKIGGDVSKAYHLLNASGSVDKNLTILGISGEGKMSGSVDVGAGVSASGSVNQYGANGEVSAYAGVKATGDASLEFGKNLPFGGAGVSAHGEAFAGAEGTGKVQAGYNPDDDSYGLNASGEVFAGAKAEGNVSGHAGPFSVSADASVRAGAGVGGEAGVNFKDGKLSVNFGGNATAGVGAGFHVSGSVDVKSIVDGGADLVHHLFS